MNRFSNQSPFVYLLLAVGIWLAVVGCDSSGSNSEDSDDAPKWIGDWEVVDAKPDTAEVSPTGGRAFLSLTTNSLVTFVESDVECDIDSSKIVNTEGNVVTSVSDPQDTDPDTAKFRLEVSNDTTLTVTPVETEEEPDFTEITAVSTKSEPEVVLNCSE